jgi:hypothetical protein
MTSEDDTDAFLSQIAAYQETKKDEPEKRQKPIDTDRPKKRLRKREEDEDESKSSSDDSSSEDSNPEEDIPLESDSEDNVMLEEEGNEEDDDDDEDSEADMVDDEENPVYIDGAEDDGEEDDIEGGRSKKQKKKKTEKLRQLLRKELLDQREDGSFCITFTPLRTIAMENFTKIIGISSATVRPVSDEDFLSKLGLPPVRNLCGIHTCQAKVPIHALMEKKQADVAAVRTAALEVASPTRRALMIVSINVPKACALVLSSPLCIYRLRVQTLDSSLPGVTPSDLLVHPAASYETYKGTFPDTALTKSELLRYEWLPFDLRSQDNQGCCSSLPIDSNVAIRFISDGIVLPSMPSEFLFDTTQTRFPESWQFTDPLTIVLPGEAEHVEEDGIVFDQRGKPVQAGKLDVNWDLPAPHSVGSVASMTFRPMSATQLLRKQSTYQSGYTASMRSLFKEKPATKDRVLIANSCNLYGSYVPHVIRNDSQKLVEQMNTLRCRNFQAETREQARPVVDEDCLARHTSSIPPHMLDWLRTCETKKKAETVVGRWIKIRPKQGLQEAITNIIQSFHEYAVLHPQVAKYARVPWFCVPDEALAHLAFAYSQLLPDSFWFVASRLTFEFAALLLMHGTIAAAAKALVSVSPHDVLYAPNLNGPIGNVLRNRLAVHTDILSAELGVNTANLQARLKSPRVGPILQMLSTSVRSMLLPTVPLNEVCDALLITTLISQLLVDQVHDNGVGNTVFISHRAVNPRCLPIFTNSIFRAIPLAGGAGVAFTTRENYYTAMGIKALIDPAGPFAGVDVVRIETRDDHDYAVQAAVGRADSDNVILVAFDSNHADLLQAQFPQAVMVPTATAEPAVLICTKFTLAHLPKLERRAHLIVPFAHCFSQVELLKILRTLTTKLPKDNNIGDLERVVAEAACGLQYARDIPGIGERVRNLYADSPCRATLTLVGLPFYAASPFFVAQSGPSMIDDLYFAAPEKRPLSEFDSPFGFLRGWSGKGSFLAALQQSTKNCSKFGTGFESASFHGTKISVIVRPQNFTASAIKSWASDLGGEESFTRVIVSGWDAFKFSELEYCGPESVFSISKGAGSASIGQESFEALLLDSVPASGIENFNHIVELGDSTAVRKANDLMLYARTGVDIQDVDGVVERRIQELGRNTESMFAVVDSLAEQPLLEELAGAKAVWAQHHKHRFGISLQMLLGTFFYKPSNVILLGDIDESIVQRLSATHNGQNWFDSYAMCNQSILPYLFHE